MDFVVQQKVKVLSFILIIIMGLVICLYSYHLFLIRSMNVFIIRTFALLSCLFVLIMIRRGYFALAGHLLLGLIFTAIWAVMFFDVNNLLVKADTVVMAVGVFSACALVLDKKKGAIFGYWLINVLALAAFCFHLMAEFNLSSVLAAEFFVDNFITLFFVATISYQVISINNLALGKARESIQIAESEVLKNKTLNETLEQKVLRRTEELSRNNLELQREITERENAEIMLKDAQDKLVENAHKAGMAEIASDTIHNVGNILNSIKTSAHIIETAITKKSVEGYSKACELLRLHQNDLANFVTNDPKGKKLVDYLLKLDDEFKEVFSEIESNTRRLKKKIDTIADVIIAQQNYAGTSSLIVSMNITDVIEDALSMIPEVLTGKKIVVAKEYQAVPAVTIQKTKLLHTLVNLFKNAVQAMDQANRDNNVLTIKVLQQDAGVAIEISDTGCGIARENLKKIFSHGFTTKKDGFGFGLHSCANYLNEMGATIDVRSAGENQGATFLLHFPV
jgi:signal transduction histidine kinase